MSKKKEHTHSWFLREVADGANVRDFEVRHFDWDEGVWKSVDQCNMSFIGTSGWIVRRKRNMHQLGGNTFPAPMTEEPEEGTKCWYATAHLGSDWNIWRGWAWDYDLLKAGILHSTQEAADAHSRALAAIARGKPVNDILF